MTQLTTKGLDSRGLFLRFMEEVKSAIRVDELAAHQKEYFDRQGAVEAERKGLKLQALGKLASVVKELRDVERERIPRSRSLLPAGVQLLLLKEEQPPGC